MTKWKAITIAAAALVLAGCHGQRQDTMLSWAENPSHQWRAAVVQREYFIDGHRDNAPTTYVIVEPGDGAPAYENGQDFDSSRIVMKPTRCGPLRVQWTSDTTLQVLCDQCGLALAEAGKHATRTGPNNTIRIDYSSFPQQSSWETGAQQPAP